MIVRSVVVLPAPLRPTRQMASLSPALSVTLRRIWLASMKTSTSRSSSMRAPHHRRHDGVIGLQLGGAAVGEHAALVQGHDAVGIAEDDVHVVLDLDDGVDAEAGGGLDEHLHDRVLVGGADAAGRLVEQDDLRVEGERAGHVEQLLVALGQRARGPRERDAVEGADAAVEHPYVDRLQQGHAGRSRASRPSSPPGKKMTTTASSAPKTKRQYAVSDITASCRKMKTTAPTTGPRKWWKPPSSSMKTKMPECVQYAT